MACGSGKTLVALRIAEAISPNGAILFLTPSISLLSQSLMDWDADSQSPLRIFSVCSDISADQRKRQNDPLHMPLLEIKIPPTTDPQKLARAFHKDKHRNGLTVIFCTYQSLEVIHQAQSEKQENPLPILNLIICDEAHRTTGQTDPASSKAETKGFQRVHDASFIRAGKRLYMTATPRIYGDRAQRKAAAKQILLASMDDEKLFGKNFYKLGFGAAIQRNILCNYQVIIQHVDVEEASRYLDAELRKPAEKSEINLDNGARMIGCWNALRKHGEANTFAENERPPADPSLLATASPNPNSSTDTSQPSSSIAKNMKKTTAANPSNAKPNTSMEANSLASAPMPFNGFAKNLEKANAKSSPTPAF